MRKNIKRILCVLLALMLVLPFQAAATDAHAAVASIKLSATERSIKAGKSFKITATVKGKDTTVKWSSTNPSVASVNQKGKVTAKKPGTATIKASANGKTKKCKVTVKKNPVKNIKKGRYTNFTAESAPSSSVVVVSAKNGKIKFVVEYNGTYGEPMYYTNTITATYENNKVSKFTWTDSWGNTGTGSLKFGKNKVTATMNVTSKAGINYWLWDEWTNNKVTVKYYGSLSASEKKNYSDTGIL